MKKLNKNIPLSEYSIINKYLLNYTEPDYIVKGLNAEFLMCIVATNDLQVIKYVFEEYYKPETIINCKNKKYTT